MTTRDRILDAAALVMRERGLARATTKEIAKAAKLSEAALYKHFRDKTDLFLAVLNERVPTDLGVVMGSLPSRVGFGSLVYTLEHIVSSSLSLYSHMFPIAASLFSEPNLLAAHRRSLDERGIGPHLVRDAIAEYLAEEQAIGRIRPDADVGAAAAMLLGACFQHAFFSQFPNDSKWNIQPDDVPAALVRTLLDSIGVDNHASQASHASQSASGDRT